MRWISLLPVLLFSSFVAGAEIDGQQMLRNAAAIAITTLPATRPAVGFLSRGTRAMFFDGPKWRGKQTRVFAWFGLPENYRAGTKVPTMLLVHGGGGTAFSQWVRIWTARGYAAMAIDTCGQVPRGKPWERDAQGGPPGWGGFEQVDEPVQDQWPFQATLDVILANSLLRSFPEVDQNRIGIDGISWGGYLTCVAAGLDPRFEFAISVYGCGYLGEDSAWVKDFQTIGAAKAAAWLGAFDPSHYLPNVRVPMLWVDGTNDLNYPFDVLRKSYELPKGPCTFVTRVRMKHSHKEGWKPEEIYAYADAANGRGEPLASITGSGVARSEIWVSFRSATPIVKAELNFTTDEGDWKQRQWQTVAADVDSSTDRVSARLPDGTTAWFCNLIDRRGLISSSKLEVMK